MVRANTWSGVTKSTNSHNKTRISLNENTHETKPDKQPRFHIRKKDWGGKWSLELPMWGQTSNQVNNYQSSFLTWSFTSNRDTECIHLLNTDIFWGYSDLDVDHKTNKSYSLLPMSNLHA